MSALLKFALRLPETEEGVACEGTALESRTVRTRKKAFLFLRSTEVRLKLGPSLKEAVARASKNPDRYSAGSGGWVKVKLDEVTDPIEVLECWIAESHGLFSTSKSAAVGAGRRSSVASKKAKRKK
jgi:hypothetical protein